MWLFTFTCHESAPLCALPLLLNLHAGSGGSPSYFLLTLTVLAAFLASLRLPYLYAFVAEIL